MKIKIKPTGEGVEDGRFRCFYEVTFTTHADLNEFIDKLQNQPTHWDKAVTWTIAAKRKVAEAYVEVPLNKKKETLIEISQFLNAEPKLTKLQKIWSVIKKPYWWWKTRKLREIQ